MLLDRNKRRCYGSVLVVDDAFRSRVFEPRETKVPGLVPGNSHRPLFDSLLLSHVALPTSETHSDPVPDTVRRIKDNCDWSLFYIDYFVSCWIRHVPAVSFLGCAVLGVVVVIGHGLLPFVLKVQNEEIRIAIRILAVCSQPGDDGEMFLRMGVPYLFGCFFTVCKVYVAAY